MSVYKQFRLLPDYIKLALKRETEYKAGFYTYMLNLVLTIVIWLVFWKVMIGKLGNIGWWEFKYIVLLTGFVQINSGIWHIFIHIWRLPREILTGELNNHLIKPVHPFIHMIMRRLGVRSTPRIAIGLVLLVIAFNRYDYDYSTCSLLFAGIISFFSFITTFMPLAIVCLSAFWIGRAEFLRDLFVELFVFQNYPISEFPKPFLAVFTFIIPLVFTATVPVLVMVKLSILQSLGLLALLCVIIFLQVYLFAFLWRRGLKRYESYGG